MPCHVYLSISSAEIKHIKLFYICINFLSMIFILKGDFSLVLLTFMFHLAVLCDERKVYSRMRCLRSSSVFSSFAEERCYEYTCLAVVFSQVIDDIIPTRVTSLDTFVNPLPPP